MDIIYPPRGDAAWNEWGGNLADLVTPDSAGDYGITGSAAEAVKAAVDAYGVAYGLAVRPATRSLPTIEAKDTALEALKEVVKPVLAILRTNPKVSDAQRRSLGLRIRGENNTPSPVPTAAPAVMAMLSGPQSLRVEVRDPADPDRRGKPRGMKFVETRAMLGPAAAGDPQTWPTCKVQGRTTLDLFFDDLATDATVWVTCRWVNNVGVLGPWSGPQAVRLPGSGVAPAAGEAAGEAAAGPSIKIAA